jgi:DNA-binding NtrC family response regulator
MFYNIKVFYISVFGAKLQIYFDMCKFFCTFVPFFSKKAKKMAKLLIIDDERGIRNTLREILADEGYEVEVAENGKQGLEMAQAKAYDLIFSDIKMPEMDGMEVLATLKSGDEPADCPVVMITGHGDVETAVQALKAGAYDFLVKPLDLNRILITTKNALESKNLRQETKQLRKKVAAKGATMVGESAAIQRVREIIDKVAPTEARVLITGPNGTGKEVVAHLIHENSARANGPMVEVNCAAIPSELIESELFGHMKGSFTGAVKDRAGKFEQADGGTLFLDEIGDMSLAAQTKVLRALQESEITRVGSDKAIKVNVRVLAATNKDLQKEIEAGNFREDLFHRLNVIPIAVPALNDRIEDIPLLVSHFAEQICGEQGIAVKEFEPAAIKALQQKQWTGNIRQLRNVVERLIILAGPKITKEDVEAYA